MKQLKLASSLILTATTVAIALQGCNPGSTLAPIPNQEAGGDQGTGGGGGGAASVGGSGGAATNGGTTTTADGGAKATGGTPTVGTGGTPPVGTGGTPGLGTGGFKAATGGYIGVATGGNPPSATGGYIGVATGGNPPMATGGNPPAATGGTPVTTGTGGATAVGNTGKTVTFSSSGKASGAMSGWASVALGTLDAITDPTCGTAKTAITNAAPCTTSTNWSTSGVCMSGSVPALPASPTSADYTNNWGVSVGVGATDPAGGGLGQSFTSVTITVTGSPTAGLRAVVHRKSDPASTTYCAVLTSATAITFTTFAVDCYNGATAKGPFIAAADVPNIDNISVQVSSTSTAITVTNLCIASITFT